MRERVGASVIRDKKILMVTGYAMTAYWTPGGNKEATESSEAGLRRELEEELGISPTHLVPSYSFLTQSFNTGEDIQATYYQVEFEGALAPAQEITGYAWASRDDFESGRIATLPSFHKNLLPRLIADNLI